MISALVLLVAEAVLAVAVALAFREGWRVERERRLYCHRVQRWAWWCVKGGGPDMDEWQRFKWHRERCYCCDTAFQSLARTRLRRALASGWRAPLAG